MPTKKQLEEEIERLKGAPRRAAREPDFSHIGGFIQKEREDQCQMLRSVALKAGISPGLLHRVETKGIMEIRTLLSICKALRTWPSIFFDSWEQKNPDWEKGQAKRRKQLKKGKE